MVFCRTHSRAGALGAEASRIADAVQPLSCLFKARVLYGKEVKTQVSIDSHAGTIRGETPLRHVADAQI